MKAEVGEGLMEGAVIIRSDNGVTREYPQRDIL